MRQPAAEVCYLPACVQTMFGEPDTDPIRAHVLAVLEAMGIAVRVPDAVASLCCGTPWKSKGMTAGFTAMSDRLGRALLEATDGGRLPVISDAVSCTEGIVESLRHQDALLAGTRIEVHDVTRYLHRHRDRLPGTRRVARAALHPTCSSTLLGVNDDLLGLARLVADEVVVPAAWRCCGFAGDRGLLHPELTASATAGEAAELAGHPFDLYLSANRTCELGMSRATGHPYRHVVAALDDALLPG